GLSASPGCLLADVEGAPRGLELTPVRFRGAPSSVRRPGVVAPQRHLDRDGAPEDGSAVHRRYRSGHLFRFHGDESVSGWLSRVRGDHGRVAPAPRREGGAQVARGCFGRQVSYVELFQHGSTKLTFS